MQKEKMNLDVSAPDQVAPVLRAVPQEYYESAGELESGWQEKAAGRPWEKIAKIL